MCGIAGIIAPVGTELRPTLLRRMASALRHRGPDDEGYLTLGDAGGVQLWSGCDTDPRLSLARLPDITPGARLGFAHRRLSILDTSGAGHQPMRDRSGRFWISFNGEIYNYLELRAALQARGRSFCTRTDTEVLLEGFAEWGMAVLPRLRGMFAFALLDTAERRLVLARDPLGIKPLYYTVDDGGTIMFASEMKALVGTAGVGSFADAAILFDFVRFGVTDHACGSVFERVRQLPAAHSLTIALDEARSGTPHAYWRLPERSAEITDVATAGAALRTALADSVAVHMRSDVPVGACLSGGLDSTAIVALAAPLMPPGRRFGTVSYIASDAELSESRWVDVVQREYPIDGSRVIVSDDEIGRDLDALVRAQDAPFGSLSVFAQYAVFRRARERGLVVMLDGQGSDELLGGYNAVVSAAIAERIARARLLDAHRLFRSYVPLGERSRSRMLLSALGRLAPAATAPALLTLVGEPLVPPWIRGRWFRDRGASLVPRPQGRGESAVDEELRLFATALTLPQLLRYEDRNSMAFSVESRVPFCDVSVASLVSTFDTSVLVTADGVTKAALRAASRGLVPDAIIDRPKLGFAAPDRHWMRTLHDRLRVLIRDQGARLPFLDVGAFLRVMDRELASGGYLSPLVWRIVSVALWADSFDVAFA